jgi:hypothetical protein
VPASAPSCINRVHPFRGSSSDMAWATVGRVEFSVLRPVRGWHDGQSVALGGRQRRYVLAVLLLRADQVTPLERLWRWFGASTACGCAQRGTNPCLPAA